MFVLFGGFGTTDVTVTYDHMCKFIMEWFRIIIPFSNVQNSC